MSLPGPHAQHLLAQYHLGQLRGEMSADLKVWQALEAGVSQPSERALEWRQYLAGDGPEALLSIWLRDGIVANDWTAKAGEARPGPLGLHATVSLSAAILLAPEWLRRSPTLLERLGQTSFRVSDPNPAGPRQHLDRRLSAAPMVSLISAMVTAGDDLSPVWQRILSKDPIMENLIRMNGSARWVGELPETEAEILVRWIGNLEFNNPPVSAPSPAWREALRPFIIAHPENEYLPQSGPLALNFAVQAPPCPDLASLIRVITAPAPRRQSDSWLISSGETGYTAKKTHILTNGAGRIPTRELSSLLNTELILNLLSPAPGEQPHLPLWAYEVASKIRTWLVFSDSWLEDHRLGDLATDGHSIWPTSQRDQLATRLRRDRRPLETDLIRLQGLLSAHAAAGVRGSASQPDGNHAFTEKVLGEIITGIQQDPHGRDLLNRAKEALLSQAEPTEN